MTQIPALIVGAGPTGLTLAAELARRGVPCRIVDRAAGPATESRALGVHARTLEVWDVMGIVQEALSRGVRCAGISVHNGAKTLAELRMSGLESPYPFALLLPQSETERILNGLVARLGAPVERETELLALTQDEAGVTARLRSASGGEETVRAQWVVGCDGAHSTVRKAIGLSFDGTTYEQHFALADARLDWSLGADHIRLFPSAEGMFAVFPLLDGIQRLLADVDPAPDGSPAPLPDLAGFQAILDRRGPGEGRITDPQWISGFRCHLRQSSRYRVGRTFLCGDACHIHSPMGGQGMNTGIQDAYNLAWKLALTAQGKAAPALLDTYEPERHAIGQQVLHLTDRLFKMGSMKHPIARAVRNTMVPVVTRQQQLQHMMALRISQIGLTYRGSDSVEEGPAIGSRWPAAAPAPGDRMPDTLFQAADGKPVRAFELLRDPRYLLLVLSGERAGADGARRALAVAEGAAGRYGDRVQACCVAGDHLPTTVSARGLQDLGFTLHRRLGLHVDGLYLIRPDGYVAFRCAPVDGTALGAYLLRWLGADVTS
jgi:2-polyprenyl-6-methoxyphenol hydroxylase-like FAD-dependent oxidoreductase